MGGRGGAPGFVSAPFWDQAPVIENPPSGQKALGVPAQDRAYLVCVLFLAVGFAARCLIVGQARSIQSGRGNVPPGFTLTIFDKRKQV